MTEAARDIMAALSSAGLSPEEFSAIVAARGGTQYCRQTLWRWRKGKTGASRSTFDLLSMIADLPPSERERLLCKR